MKEDELIRLYSDTFGIPMKKAEMEYLKNKSVFKKQKENNEELRQ